MSYYIFGYDNRENYDHYCFYENAFSVEECEKIIEIGNDLAVKNSRIDGDREDASIRKSRNSWISYQPEYNWLYERLKEFALSANEVRYKFDLTGFMEDLQFTVYDKEGSFYQHHMDFGAKVAIRKLSIVVFLSDPETYEGGEIDFYMLGSRKFSQGTLVAFPSFEVHGVKPVTKGIRYSLVAWTSGPPFR